MRRLLSREGIGVSLVVLAAAALLLAWAAPNDVTLAGTSKVVYLHGALAALKNTHRLKAMNVR